MNDYPTLSKQFDANSLKISFENPAVSSGDSQGGINHTRRKFTRKARRTFTFIHRSINNADKLLLEEHWEEHGGGSLAFNWLNPQSGETVNVRFDEQMTLDFERDGVGTVDLWNTSTVTLKEV